MTMPRLTDAELDALTPEQAVALVREHVGEGAAAVFEEVLETAPEAEPVAIDLPALKLAVANPDAKGWIETRREIYMSLGVCAQCVPRLELADLARAAADAERRAEDIVQKQLELDNARTSEASKRASFRGLLPGWR